MTAVYLPLLTSQFISLPFTVCWRKQSCQSQCHVVTSAHSTFFTRTITSTGKQLFFISFFFFFLFTFSFKLFTLCCVVAMGIERYSDKNGPGFGLSTLVNSVSFLLKVQQLLDQFKFRTQTYSLLWFVCFVIFVIIITAAFAVFRSVKLKCKHILIRNSETEFFTKAVCYSDCLVDNSKFMLSKSLIINAVCTNFQVRSLVVLMVLVTEL